MVYNVGLGPMALMRYDPYFKDVLASVRNVMANGLQQIRLLKAPRVGSNDFASAPRTNTGILQTRVSGTPLILSRGTKVCDPCVYVLVGCGIRTTTVPKSFTQPSLPRHKLPILSTTT